MDTTNELSLVHFFLSREMAKIMYQIQNSHLLPSSTEFRSKMKLLQQTRQCLDNTEQKMTHQSGSVSDLIRSISTQLDLNMEYLYANRALDPDILKQSFQNRSFDFQKMYQAFTGKTFKEEEAVRHTAKLIKKHGILPE